MGTPPVITLEKLAELIGSMQAYSCEISDDILRITCLDTESQFIAEMFDNSVQLRQAVFFEYNDLNERSKFDIQNLCSMMNERFSLTKLFVDRWGVLVNASDIFSSHVECNYLNIVLGQVEHMSLSILSAIELSDAENRPLNDADLDGIFSYKQ
ncbi:MAG: hypothetical protein H6918_05515 [Sphingomonadaceae bacterium]|nr:hypothetical protein [Sphingomonadaceae bacterium]